MHPFFHRYLIAHYLFFTRGKMPKPKKQHKEANNPKQPENAAKKEGKADQKGDSARKDLALKGNRSKASADKTGSKNVSKVTRKSEPPTKSDAPDEDDESVTVSVDNVDMEEVEDKKKSKKKRRLARKKCYHLASQAS